MIRNLLAIVATILLLASPVLAQNMMGTSGAAVLKVAHAQVEKSVPRKQTAANQSIFEKTDKNEQKLVENAPKTPIEEE